MRFFLIIVVITILLYLVKSFPCFPSLNLYVVPSSYAEIDINVFIQVGITFCLHIVGTWHQPHHN